MSEEKLSSQSIAKPLDQVLLKDCKIKVKLTELITNKIKFLCREIAREEWSGVLFYSVEGSIADPNKMEITLENLYPMDKGSAGATDYLYGEDVVSFRMDNPETNYFKVGHIHSHHSMGVFFSGTDTSELTDNVRFHNYYLSVIVNNFLDIDARVAFVGTETVSDICGKNEDGEPYTICVSGKKEYMFYYQCEIIRENMQLHVDVGFIGRVKEIIQKALRPKPNVMQQSEIAGKKWNFNSQRWEDDTAIWGKKPEQSATKGYWDADKQIWVEPVAEQTKKLWEEFQKADIDHPKNNLISPRSYDTDAINPRNFPQDETDDDFEHASELEDYMIEVLTSYPSFVNELSSGFPEIITMDDVFLYLQSRLTRKMLPGYFNFVIEHLFEGYRQSLYEEKNDSDEDIRVNFYDDIEIMIQIVEEYRVEYRVAAKFNSELIKLKLEIESTTPQPA